MFHVIFCEPVLVDAFTETHTLHCHLHMSFVYCGLVYYFTNILNFLPHFIQAGEICQFSVDLRPTSNDLFYRAPAAAVGAAPSAPFDARNGRGRPGWVNGGAELCRENMLGGGEDIIEIMLTQKNYYRQREGIQSALLIGRHFKAFVMYTPNPYDSSLVYFKVELYKLYQQVEGRQSQGANGSSSAEEESSVGSETKHNHLIENVNTFAVLPTGELMVFFTDHFCLINYYNLEVTG